MSNEAHNPASCQTAVSGSGYINNPMTVDEIANNANVQMGNIEYYLSIKRLSKCFNKSTLSCVGITRYNGVTNWFGAV